IALVGRSAAENRIRAHAALLRLSRLIADDDGYADQGAVLGPRAVVVLDVGVAEQLAQDKPGVRRALTDAAVRDRGLAAVETGRGVQRPQLLVGLEGAVLVRGLRPRHVDRRRDVTRALRLLLGQVRRREQAAGVLVRGAHVDEVLLVDRVDDLVPE